MRMFNENLVWGYLFIFNNFLSDNKEVLNFLNKTFLIIKGKKNEESF